MLPEGFLSRMQKLLGAEYGAFLASYDRPRNAGLRRNPLKTDEPPALSAYHLSPVPWARDGFYYDPDTRPGLSPLHEAGLYYLQEPSAMAPAGLLDAQPGERVLDLCAAPGGKSTQLAAAMQGRGILVCNEIQPKRARILSGNLERLGAANALTLNEHPQRLESRFAGWFDKILVDAPCSGEGMTRIVQDLLTLSKIDYGKMEMNITRFSFAEAVKKVYEAAVMNARSHGHTMSFHCEEQVADVNGDRERIEQVVMNIVSNAIKYTPDGGRIELAVGQKGQTVYVRVSDNGIGIPEKDLPRLFERFYRVDKARSRESGGTGLGLSIAKEILNQHKGDIRIDSVYGEGTDVLITLPAAT